MATAHTLKDKLQVVVKNKDSKFLLSFTLFYTIF